MTTSQIPRRQHRGTRAAHEKGGAGIYGWVWQRLPGGMGIKATSLTLIAVAVLILLWFVVFPWATLHLPIDQAGLGG